jgi:ATP-dependent DNA helicase RecQ
MPDIPPLLPLLKQYFGFDSFRPLQEAIIRDALAGRDTFALLPTGGGKSLCFQLPALARDGLTVVVSPLIALMKDQVDALLAAGAPATFLNSTLTPAESRERYRRLQNGEIRLLYVAPERLMLDGTLEQLRGWNVRQFAIDEAHCISEWGHDFRPEYRQIAQLRKRFPTVPMMALTATATERVRDDIVRQLALRNPGIYVASFNRPNLTYRVAGKTQAYGQLLDFCRGRPRDAGIVYCASRNATEQVAGRLNADGVTARPYHAGLSAEERAANQEAFLRDEVRVVCATIAFGMGINKPNVRFVVHYDLPKSIESYYQETGRAGRVGLPGECLLFFSAGDVQKQLKFIDEKPDPKEKELAREQLQLMVHYAESADCRRAELLRYFAETYPEPSCGGCDNCLSPRETFDGTVAAQKLLSCVYRIRQHGSFAVGLNHVCEVLTGADTVRIRQWGHQQLSTYGIGREHDKRSWQAIGRELIRLGFLAQSTERFSTVTLTDAGLALLKKRTPVTLTRPMATGRTANRAGEIDCDDALFEALRGVRKRLADDRGVPPYIIFSDVSLWQMARDYPTTDAEFGRISGVGAQKLREFGAAFLGEIRHHVAHAPQRTFAPAAPAGPPPKPAMTDTIRDSLNRYRTGESVEAIAAARSLSVPTVRGHLAVAIEYGETLAVSNLVPDADFEAIAHAIRVHGPEPLAGIHAALVGKFDYGLIRIVRAAMAVR